MDRKPCVIGVHYGGEGPDNMAYYFGLANIKYNAPDDPPTCNRCVKEQMTWCADGEWICPVCGHRWFQICKEQMDSYLYWCPTCHALYGLPEREYNELSRFGEKFCCEQCRQELEPV